MKKFTEPKIEILPLEVSDIVTTSSIDFDIQENELIGWKD